MFQRGDYFDLHITGCYVTSGESGESEFNVQTIYKTLP
jgi:hypothetical protein